MQNNDIRLTDEDRRGNDVENTIFGEGQNSTPPLEPANSCLNITENISKVLTNSASIVGYSIGCLTALGVAIDCTPRDNDLECINKSMPLVAIPIAVCLGIASAFQVLKNNYPEQYQRIFSGGPTATLGFVNTESRTPTQLESTQSQEQPSIQQSTRQEIPQPPTSLVLFSSPSRSEPVQVNANSIDGANAGR